ncbi:hypothetical protein GCM10023165_09420 [Variovorax defluvii]|uniref:Uncharacterized protein n=1 Tax=Variovorax defluvii TaxID=913761 RepID=A0ABP8H431_9BURK
MPDKTGGSPAGLEERQYHYQTNAGGEHASRAGPAQRAGPAKQAVVAEEAAHFMDFLATWKPWQKLLREGLPDAVATIEAQLSEHRKQIERAVTDTAKAAEVPPDILQDSITRAIVQSDNDEEAKLWLELTQEVLNGLRN